MRGTIEEVNTMSTLPEPLLHHIMSYLSFEEVVYYSLLCKRWMQAWLTLPVIEYDEMPYDLVTREKIMEFLERTLLNRHVELTTIDKFSLRMQLWEDRVSFVDRCLCYVIGSNVKELKLDGMCYLGNPNWWYRLPQFVLCAKSIEVLELTGCKLELRRSNPKLPALRRLCLMRVYANDHVIENLVSGSPLVEYLKIGFCEGFQSLELYNLHKLNKIKVFSHLHGLKQVDVNALNVQSLAIRVPSALCEINAAHCKSLKRLKLCMLSIVDDWLCNEICKLPFLEYLNIMDCDKLERIKISSPSLKQLLIIRGSNLLEVKLETSNLSRFEYMGDIISFSLNDLALSEADLHFHSENADIQWFVKYIELLAKFNQFSKTLYLHSNAGENAIIPREIRQILRPPLPGVKHVDFTVTDEDNFYPITIVLDGLLWISPHAETISIQYEFGYDKFSFQFSYKQQLVYEGVTPRCCQSFPVSCWQHCVKEVKVEHVIHIVGKMENVTSFCFEDEEFLEKIEGICRYKP